ncbi:class I SAM-dependent methyltransferase [Nocardioides massiliensis]|uniref:SAM-dependent methyltransferase n=1 Tax=Nocardioides massiliensis TaxID=1325935 RepID=A0ABT9NLN7_9ACTN|nr:class I SAM-dependent methyltransferase [Nocardioides massiliensis]MDP9820950.1 SAM-dependent methyltransferase [Nocardioides massiliensis]
MADVHPSRTPERGRYARSFGAVAADYDRARPSYPDDAVGWLVGDRPARVLELGAGTGKLTERLVGRGHEVLATEPDAKMLRRLREQHAAPPTGLATAQAAAEQLPVANRSVDVVVAAQAAHWFDHERVLAEAARVLRPGGVLAWAWNIMDTRIPWVRRLRELIGSPAEVPPEPVAALTASELFGEVETAAFRFWHPLDRTSLAALVSSNSVVSLASEEQRAEILDRADALYDEYGRGPDGMLLPYLTHSYRATVLDTGPEPDDAGADPLGTDALLIDFR